MLVPGAFDPANDEPRLTPFRRRHFSALWPSLVKIDPVEQEEERREMLTFMGRHGRQSWFDRDWWDVDLEELKAKFHSLSKVIRMENVKEPTPAGLGRFDDG